MSYNLVNPTTGDLTRVAGGTLYADNPIGSIIPFGSSTIPTGYLLCNGQAVSRTTYSELFAVIGAAFGSGDGSTTFNVPDLRETVPVGSGTRGSGVTEHDTYNIGEFKDDQMQSHNHYEAANAGGSDQVWGNVASSSGQTTGWYTGYIREGRSGTTTHGKQLGVHYIIKAKHVGIPSDFIDAVDEAVEDVYGDIIPSDASASNKLVTEFSAAHRNNFWEWNNNPTYTLDLSSLWNAIGIRYAAQLICYSAYSDGANPKLHIFAVAATAVGEGTVSITDVGGDEGFSATASGSSITITAPHVYNTAKLLY